MALTPENKILLLRLSRLLAPLTYLCPQHEATVTVEETADYAPF